MTLPMESAPPAYIIYRDTPQGEPFDPTAPPQFFPPKDSDELFDALRVKFPHVKTHSERMRDAVIEFLLEERQAEQLKSASPMFPTETAATSPWQSWPSMSSGAGSSTLSSPETLNLETPASTGSPQFQPPQMSRQYSTATSESTPPALDQMTSVFSLSAESQPKTRVRRKMTEEEKIEYRKRRIVKACEKCSKRKRKCHHNKPEMETAPIGSAKTAKVTKSRTSTTKSSPVAAQVAQAQQSTFHVEKANFTDATASMQPMDDFSYMLEDPLPELNFDDLMQFDQPIQFDSSEYRLAGSRNTPVQFPWSDSQDWTLMDSFGTDAIQSSEGYPTEFDELMDRWQDNQSQTPLQSAHNASNGFRRVNRPRTEECLGGSTQGSAGNGMLWEHLRTGQVDPTHTLHTHAAQKPDAHENRGIAAQESPFTPSPHDPLAGSLSHGLQCPRTAMARRVLRLSGTVKAVRAFGSLLQTRQPPIGQKFQVGSVLDLVLEIKYWSTSLQRDRGHTDGFFMDAAGLGANEATPSTSLVRQHSTRDRQLSVSTSRSFNHRLGFWPDDLDQDEVPRTLWSTAASRPCGSELPDGCFNEAADVLSEPAVEGPLEVMRIADYLRMKNNIEDVATSGLAFTRVPTGDPILTDSGAGAKELASTSVQVGSGLDESTAQEGRHLNGDNCALPTPLITPSSIRGAYPGASGLSRRKPAASGLALSRVSKNNPMLADPGAGANGLASTSVQVGSGLDESAAQEGRLLGDDNCVSPIPQLTPSSITASYVGASGLSRRTSPMHTLSRNSTNSTSSSEADQHLFVAYSPASLPEQANVLHGSMGECIRIGLAPGSSPNSQAEGKDMEHGINAARQGDNRDEWSDRKGALELHHRTRDHHGRLVKVSRSATVSSSTSEAAARNGEHGPNKLCTTEPLPGQLACRGRFAEVSYLLASLGCLLLLVRVLPAGIPLSWIVLALCTPVAGSKGCHFRERTWRSVTPMWGVVMEKCGTVAASKGCHWPWRLCKDVLQCTIKNSLWLAFEQRTQEARPYQRKEVVKWTTYGSAVGFVH